MQLLLSLFLFSKGTTNTNIYVLAVFFFLSRRCKHPIGRWRCRRQGWGGQGGEGVEMDCGRRGMMTLTESPPSRSLKARARSWIMALVNELRDLGAVHGDETDLDQRLHPKSPLLCTSNPDRGRQDPRRLLYTLQRYGSLYSFIYILHYMFYMLFYMKDWKIFVVIAFDERSRRFDGSVGSWIESIWSGSLPQFSDLLRSRTLITVPKLQSPLLLDPLSTMLILELAWSMDVLFGNQKFTITFLFLLAEYGGNWQGLCLWWTLNRQPRNILCWHSQCFILSLLAVGRKFMGCLCRMLDCYMKILIFFFFIFLTGLCLRPISIGLYLTTFFQLLNFALFFLN